jgi:hypothetical protein
VHAEIGLMTIIAEGHCSQNKARDVLARAIESSGVVLPRGGDGKVAGLPSRSSIQRLAKVAGAISDQQVGQALSRTKARGNGIGVAHDGGSCGGFHTSAIVCTATDEAGKKRAYVSGAFDNDGKGTAKDGADEIAANVEHLAQVARAADTRLAAAGFSSPASSGSFNLTDVKSVTSDSASAALAVAPLLSKLKHAKNIELLGEDGCRRLAAAREPGTQDAAVLTSLSVQGGGVRLQLRPFTLPPVATAPPPAAPRPAWHVPPPDCPDGHTPADFVNTLGEWLFLHMSDDEKTSSGEIVQINCLFHAAGHATEAMSNAIEEAAMRDIEQEFPKLKELLYSLFTNGQVYTRPAAGTHAARHRMPSPSPISSPAFARVRARLTQAPARRPRRGFPATTTTTTTRSTTTATRYPRRRPCSRRRTGPITPSSAGS